MLHKHVKSEQLRRHALAVEAAVHSYAAAFQGDPEMWATVGLLHDLDYEEFPEPPAHANETAKILRAEGYPEEVVMAILSHAEWTGVPRDTPLRRALWACDELTGFIAAAALVRPSKKLSDTSVASIVKKMKDKAFCRPVNRDDLREGARLLGLPFEEHVGNVLAALRKVAKDLGL